MYLVPLRSRNLLDHYIDNSSRENNEQLHDSFGNQRRCSACSRVCGCTQRRSAEEHGDGKYRCHSPRRSAGRCLVADPHLRSYSVHRGSCGDRVRHAQGCGDSRLHSRDHRYLPGRFNGGAAPSQGTRYHHEHTRIPVTTPQQAVYPALLSTPSGA